MLTKHVSNSEDIIECCVNYIYKFTHANKPNINAKKLRIVNINAQEIVEVANSTRDNKVHSVERVFIDKRRCK